MNKSILEQINSPADLRGLSLKEMGQLSEELRRFIIDIIAIKEGHLGASLGVIELTIALHYVFNTPDDLLVWDVGHQAYGHKILTGRRNEFHSNRQLGGLSGFPSRKESPYDTFGVGHSSTAISAALGMALASTQDGQIGRQHIAVVGDASIASGMAFEALNHAGVSHTNLLIVLNDNAIGIDPSVGAFKEYLTRKKEADAKPSQDNLFRALNFHYSGPVDGHDLSELIEALNTLKSISGPKVLHVVTVKGKGLKQAEQDQVAYHAPGQFDPKTGERPLADDRPLPPKYQDVFGHTLVSLARENKNIFGITPAMPTGSSLRYMMDAFPERAIDVGIAEQHAVTLAAGLATQGKIVFCAIYATFFQRAYDQVIHDVCLQNLPVIFCLDRAGIVGEDGATHHGVFDLASLRPIPNLIIFAPRDARALRNMMFTAQRGLTHPIAIRYPRGRGNLVDWQTPMHSLDIGTAELLQNGTTIAVLSLGAIADTVTLALNLLENKQAVTHVDMRFLKPLDEALLHKLCQTHQAMITVEDGMLKGGLAS
ncbi:MAG: 1-deoxy-D-xylulose-5-phosphate synthase, partial [Bacteroidetes bacterium]|nr:1-deoxy-D-xylulose-5-phosphate synthase [Bacteroidota bacterium]